MNALAQAKTLTDEILALTAALVLTGAKDAEESEVEAYVNLVEARRPLVEKLTALNIKDKNSEEFKAVQATIETIAGIDRQHLEHLEAMREVMNASLKDVKHGQRIHAGYQAQADESMHSRFDIKQ